LFLVAVWVLVLVAGCGSPMPPAATTMAPAASPAVVTEYAVTEIPLSGPVAAANAEISGLAWYGDELILLPQYPARFGQGGDGALLALSRAEILAYLDGQQPGPLAPRLIPFTAPGLSTQIAGFEGYEALAFAGDQAFLSIEASPASGMRGYVVTGRLTPDLSELVVDPGTLTEIAPLLKVANKSDEALLVAGDRLLGLYEVNGAKLNSSPAAHVFSLSLAPEGTIPFPAIEYRITDATALDAEGRFWAINYFFPGDTEQLTDHDPLAERYGEGPTHAQYEPVERLLEFAYDPTGIRLVERPPIQLELLPDDEARNWEGLARLEGRGFLLATDKFPTTILGFVAFADGE
jgi:hypothetical protein